MASDQQEKQPKKPDQGVRDMVSAIMSRIPDLHLKPGSSSHHQHQDEDERGIRVVTLAGNNIGASLKTDQPDEKSGAVHPDGVFFGEDGQSDAMTTYVNSNFQAINNSIMMDGKYEANDPGVHLDITDVVETNKGKFRKHGKKGKKNKKKKKEVKEKEKENGESSSSSDDEDSESSDGKEATEQKDQKTGPKKEGEPLQQSMVAP